jgi:hypothetical protein
MHYCWTWCQICGVAVCGKVNSLALFLRVWQIMQGCKYLYFIVLLLEQHKLLTFIFRLAKYLAQPSTDPFHFQSTTSMPSNTIICREINLLRPSECWMAGEVLQFLQVFHLKTTLQACTHSPIFVDYKKFGFLAEIFNWTCSRSVSLVWFKLFIQCVIFCALLTQCWGYWQIVLLCSTNWQVDQTWSRKCNEDVPGFQDATYGIVKTKVDKSR